jgi:hypothetical protein
MAANVVKVASTKGPSRTFRPESVLSSGGSGTGSGVPSSAYFAFEGDRLRLSSTLQILICRVPMLVELVNTHAQSLDAYVTMLFPNHIICLMKLVHLLLE